MPDKPANGTAEDGQPGSWQPQSASPAESAAERIGLWTAWGRLPRPTRRRVGGFVTYQSLLTLLFIQPLTRLMLHVAHSGLHSYILLVPAVAGCLLFIERRSFFAAGRGSVFGTASVCAVGFAALAAKTGWNGSLSVNDDLALVAIAFVSFVAAGGFLFLGSKWMTAAAFPVAFLIFMVPLPDAAVMWLERVSALASAEAAALYFNLAGTSLVRRGTVFELPGIVLQVAQECSGIRSSWVLFITSLVASHLFLRSRWRRIILVAFVIPLGILRNGFRILVIGLLCTNVGSYMIDSPIHHRGGPLFFALSLGPLFLLAWWLRRQERRRKLPA
jgi:exosortase C (VPDSG-CTERM-specific)